MDLIATQPKPRNQQLALALCAFGLAAACGSPEAAGLASRGHASADSVVAVVGSSTWVDPYLPAVQYFSRWDGRTPFIPYSAIKPMVVLSQTPGTGQYDVNGYWIPARWLAFGVETSTGRVFFQVDGNQGYEFSRFNSEIQIEIGRYYTADPGGHQFDGVLGDIGTRLPPPPPPGDPNGIPPGAISTRLANLGFDVGAALGRAYSANYQ